MVIYSRQKNSNILPICLLNMNISYVQKIIFFKPDTMIDLKGKLTYY